MKQYRISILLVFVMCFVSSCINLEPQPDCTRYFVLGAKSKEPREKQVQETKEWVLGIWPVSIPPYLAKHGIALKISPNELNYSAWNRWAEPIERGFSRVLAEDLRLRLQNFNIISYTRSLTEIKNYELYATVNDFIGDASCARVYLKVSWLIKDSLTGNAILIENSTIEVPLTGNLDCENVAAGMSEAIAKLSDIISDKLKAAMEML